MIDRVFQSDIETFLGYSLFSFWDVENDVWWEFSINKNTNDVLSLVKFLEDNKLNYFAFYNGLKFDLQVIQFVIDEYKNWIDLSNLEICEKIWQRAQDEINNSNYNVRNTYFENQFSIKGLDLMEIPHFSNEAKRTSLKWLAFMLDMENIEDLPFEHNKKNFTDEELEKVRIYCRKDIKDTYKWYLYLKGECTHAEYKNKNKFEERINLIEEFGFPDNCLNWNDVRIGEELNKKGYCDLTNSTEQELYTLKRNRKGTKPFTYGQAIPSYVKFKTKEFNDFYNSVKNVRVSLIQGNKQEFPFTYNGTKYTIMRGGIHSTEENRVVVPNSNEILRDADIGSQYPNAIVKRELYPSHLGKAWLVNYKKTIEKRIEYKSKSKESDKYKSLSDMLKLALNGGGFGKTNDVTSWQYDPRVMYFCTIGNQFEILMLIEMLELEGIHCISANTDGILCLFNKELEEKYYTVCKEWEIIVGNSEMGKLEYCDFKKIWQESINHYIAIKTDDSVKIKGRFAYEVELNKNNTDKIGRIERKAIVEYVTKGTPIETTIKNSKNIYDYCIGVKASKNYFFQTVETKQKYNRILRFYISNKGESLLKIKREDADTNGSKIIRVCNEYKITPFMDYINKKDYDLNYEYYINKANEIIYKVENKGKKLENYNKNQLSMF